MFQQVFLHHIGQDGREKAKQKAGNAEAIPAQDLCVSPSLEPDCNAMFAALAVQFDLVGCLLGCLLVYHTVRHFLLRKTFVNRSTQTSNSETIYIAPYGKVWHVDHSCDGLNSATVVYSRRACLVCTTKRK